MSFRPNGGLTIDNPWHGAMTMKLTATRHGPTHHLELVEPQQMPASVTILTYRLAGRATFGSVG